MLHDIDYVLAKLDWMRRERIWPNGPRYLWTGAFGLVLLISLYRETGERRWLDEAEELAAAVERVLGRQRGFRIGEAPERDGQFESYRSGDEYDREAITHVMACTSHYPGAFLVEDRTQPAARAMR